MIRGAVWAATLSCMMAVAPGESDVDTTAVDSDVGIVRVVWERDETGFAHDLLLRRVVAELELRGFEVRLVERGSQSTPSSEAALGSVVLEAKPETEAASLRWTPRESERGSGEFVPVSAARDAPEIAAVQIAELVVATIENSALGEPVVQPVNPDVVVPAPEPLVLAPRWRLNLGLALLASPGGLGLLAGPHASASASLGAARRFGVGVGATASALTAKVSGTSQEHRIGLASLRAHALWWPRPAARWSPSLGLGGGTLIAWADPGGVTTVGVISAVGDLSVGLTDRLAIWAGARVELAVPRVQVRVQERVLATAGQPLLEVGLGLQIRG